LQHILNIFIGRVWQN